MLRASSPWQDILIGRQDWQSLEAVVKSWGPGRLVVEILGQEQLTEVQVQMTKENA
jgi:hypothetical protein